MAREAREQLQYQIDEKKAERIINKYCKKYGIIEAKMLKGVENYV